MPRYAPVMSIADFKQTLISFADANDFTEEHGIDLSAPDWESVAHAAFYEAEMQPGKWKKVRPDLEKIEFDTENIMFEGFETLSNGVSVMLLNAGGDWEEPVMCAVYYDGTQFRGYVPKDGNTYNLTTKTAYGNDEDDDDADKLKRYGKTDFYPDHDLPLILADIANRIHARGTCGAVDFGKNVAKEEREIAKANEPDLDASPDILADLLYFEITPCAGGCYCKFKLRCSGRYITFTEGQKIKGIPEIFTTEEASWSDIATWYSPDWMSTSRMARYLIDAGFTRDPGNEDVYQTTRVIVI